MITGLRFWRAVRSAARNRSGRATAFHVSDDHRGRWILGAVGNGIGDIDIDFVAGGQPIAQAEAALSRQCQDVGADGAGLT